MVEVLYFNIPFHLIFYIRHNLFAIHYHTLFQTILLQEKNLFALHDHFHTCIPERTEQEHIPEQQLFPTTVGLGHSLGALHNT